MNYTIETAARALRAGEVTSVELVASGFSRADAMDDRVGAFISRYDATALASAAELDRELQSGNDRGPLHGIPVGLKDVISAREGVTTAQSRVLEPEWGSFGDAEAVARLRASGAVIVGKLTTMEFAGGRVDDDSPYPVPRNPWDLERSPGVSSSGSGAGVAAQMMLGALGTDTGGSIRCPAAFCGITGFKPTYDVVPKEGMVPFAWSYDTVGPMARSVWDCAVMFESMAGASVISDFKTDLSGTKIGIDRSLLLARPDADPAVNVALDEAVAVFRELGAVVTEVTVPMIPELSDASMLQSAAEGYAWHRNRLRARWSDYGAGVKATLMKGLLLNAGDMIQLDRVRAFVAGEIAEFFDGLDAVIVPTAHVGAPLLANVGVPQPANLAHLGGLPRFTAAWNGLGYPALSVPIGFTNQNMPIAMQLVAPSFEDSLVLRLGHAYQQKTGWHLARPPIVD